ncbi:hypothetical protein FA13DRAFT_1738021 [Coprinellus micaceus]|uniref:Uncharacterized protein n=1 Tax=Coprinellus micaceus TaxID=71717 RepID=A0A4Y7SV05_COPMI|nr:hypothetical protein FA13DRAFT_1738021 [Coprinellus micaceus]
MPPRRSKRAPQATTNATAGPSTLNAPAASSTQGAAASGAPPPPQYGQWYTTPGPSLSQFPPQAWPHQPLFSHQAGAFPNQAPPVGQAPPFGQGPPFAPGPQIPPPPPYPQAWSILPIPGKLDTYQCRPVTAPVGYSAYLPPPGGYPVYAFGTFPDMSASNTKTALDDKIIAQYPTTNKFPQLPAYMTPTTGMMTSTETGLVAPPTQHPEPDFGPPPVPPAEIVHDTYIWCGRIDDKPTLDESSGMFMNKRCRHLILRSMEGIQHHYREVHGMEWFTNDQKCNWGSSCKVRKTGKNIPKHVYDLHVTGNERLCESKACKLPQERDSRWCKSDLCGHIEPLPQNVYA